MKQLNNFISAFSAKPLMLLTFLALLPTLANAQCPDNNHPHMIDLGLPSGTKWACCNVGASKPEDYGGYYAWGETEEKDVYSYETYIYGYNEYIGLDISGTNYDVAHVKWGVSWKMPTTEDFKELIDNCTYIWTQQDGTEGSKFTGNNGNSIFIPDAGWNSPDNHDATRNSLCWTSSLVQSDGRVAYMFAGNRQGTPFHEAPMNRPYGLAVRPVVAGSSTLSGIAIDETNFPDENFRNWVLNQSYGRDGVLTEEEIAGVTEINVEQKNIASLKGIEYFTALTELNCQINLLLTSLDVSKNTALSVLNCCCNQLTSIDVSKNTALSVLNCGSNQLTSIDVSKNTALETFWCYANLLTSLDVSKNTALTKLECNINQLTSLDVSKNIALEWLDCSYTQLTSLDVSKNSALRRLWCSGNQLTSLDVSKNTALTKLECDGNQLTSLDVSKNIALEWLDCQSCQLTSLDVSKNTALISLNCDENQLTSLDVSQNTALEYLHCQNNQLTSLDVSKNSALLSYLNCNSNKIRGTAMDALIAGLPETGGNFYAIILDDSYEQNVVTKAQVAAAKEKHWTTYYYSYGDWFEYEGSEPELEPIDNGESIDIGNEIDENTNLDGNVVGDVYYCISSGDGSYDPEEGCLVVTKPTEDSAIDGKDIFGEDFKDNYAGFMFMVAPGEGSINVEAETTGNMVLKVKVGDNAPAQMEVNGKTKVSFSYDVSEPTMVFIYGSIAAAGAKGMMKAAGTGALKIYGIEVTSETDGIEDIKNERLKMNNSSVYNLNGQRVESSKFKVQNSKLPKGIYIQNGKKVLVK